MKASLSSFRRGPIAIFGAASPRIELGTIALETRALRAFARPDTVELDPTLQTLRRRWFLHQDGDARPIVLEASGETNGSVTWRVLFQDETDKVAQILVDILRLTDDPISP